MTEKKRKPIEPQVLKIKRPDHEPVTVTLCGHEYEFHAPQGKREHIKLHGITSLAQSKMASTLAGVVSVETSLRVAQADNPDEAAVTAFEGMANADKLATLAGMEVAIDEVFEAVCFALRFTDRQRAYLDANFDLGELFVAFNLIAGLINRPFGGTPSAMRARPKTRTG